MPRTILLEAVGGIAGDMFVAAMLDACPDLSAQVLADANAVLPDGIGEAWLEPGQSNGIRVLRLKLGRLQEVRQTPHSHDHGGDGHHHHHAADGATEAGHGEPRLTRYRDLVARIEGARLGAGTARHAIAILTILAEAEAHIHGVPLAEVHFHEIADWDSLLDVVAAGSIAAALAGAVWRVGDLPRGAGLVRTQHGLLPVPAPATAAILRGFSWRDDGVGGERVTPTGAAILRHLIGDPAAPAAIGGRLAACGYGAGTRTLTAMPNILRASLFDSAEQAATPDNVVVTEFEVDDMTGEEIAVACDRLRAHPGVLDVSLETRIGKKGRTLHGFRILSDNSATMTSVHAECFRETATIGLRWRLEQREILPRTHDVSATEPALRRKIVRRPGDVATVKVESDDLAPVATLAERRLLKQAGEAGPAS
ncbi:LarC family nickel insertion protein [Bosea sp. (in: a-proteobacteria)]|uniref:LarC family nickel insertion protein n=1 Tax=Bosea sp. (in: a-proteobacteria) TaxID=1871050 RepID=UPI0026237363|nr:LarC family nickel insertion protein [Bosea sp. (in: a-proteobacteria)]MCO5090365.1 LarC family nickel insertion protein [Bosea sp. (in: a-proteobacteria)]